MNVQININGLPVSVPGGVTILQAARQNGFEIPTLCDYPGLPPHGSCRMCIVEIQGWANTPTSCTTPVQEGMVIRTESPKVQSLRADILRMLLSEHPSACMFCPEKSHCDECMITVRKAGSTTGCRSCPKDETCELKALVETTAMDGVGYPTRYRGVKVRKDDPFLDMDFNLCILCGRCIRTCEELHFNNAMAYTQRGSDSLIGTAFSQTLAAAGCSFCGSCVEVCPTGTLSEKTRKWDGKAELAVTSTCPFCSIGCQVQLDVKDGAVIGSLPAHAAGTDQLCVLGRFGVTETVNHPSRLKEPARRTAGQNEGISWEEAVHLAAKRLTGCAPDRFEMVLSADCTNEDQYVAQKFTRQVMKSERISSPVLAQYGAGLPALARLLSKSQPLEALKDATFILNLGFDGGYAQSVVEVHAHTAHRKGAQLVTLATREGSLGRYSDVCLLAHPGKEVEMLRALIQLNAAERQAPASNGGALREAAGWLARSERPVMIVGPDFLSHPDNSQLLEAIETLAEESGAALIVLPAQANLAGLLRSGAFHSAAPVSQAPADVLYLLGSGMPANLAAGTYTIFQNIYHPAQGAADLLFPAAAFTETSGTLTSQAGKENWLHPAVPAPGAARPAWQVLCQIARVMGAEGFAFESLEAVRAEMDKQAAFAPETIAERISPTILNVPGEYWNGVPVYMGFVMAQTVEGLQSLYPGRSAHAPEQQAAAGNHTETEPTQMEGLHV